MSVYRHKGHTFSFLLGGVVYGTDYMPGSPPGQAMRTLPLMGGNAFV